MNAQHRQWLYTAAALASAIVPILVAYNVIDTDVAGAWVNLIGVLGGLGTVGASSAAVMTSRQRKDGTLDFTGTAPEQAIAAIQATVQQASTAVTDLARVKDVVNGVLSAAAPVVPAAVEALTPKVVEDTGNADPSSANYQP